MFHCSYLYIWKWTEKSSEFPTLYQQIVVDIVIEPGSFESWTNIFLQAYYLSFHVYHDFLGPGLSEESSNEA